ncbi:MAG: molecular chaperone HtpG [Alphaproteobacteria bacterium]|nr:molecular chaperone HtpG [Alphaproteobacteria bacterium]
MSKDNTSKPQEFQAEVGKLLHMMVHSVYSDRDVFLRELISNSSDALDKLRYEAIAKPELLEQDARLELRITPDKAAKTLTITDSGIGMSAKELTDNLGTIARSGTQAFAAKAKDAPELIGQFGVGFYAAFMVAKEVEVFSRKAGAKACNVWRSKGEGTFTVDEAEKLERGTRIVLHLRDDAADYLEAWKIEEVVKTYSDHITHPIMLVEEGGSRQINSASAIWMQPKAKVTAEQHKEFFGTLSHTSEAPALTIHYRAEGKQEYNVLLYVPGERPFDLYDPERKGRQKLYVKRVFIADDAALLPPYLRFVRGVIDSSDMPLNISREMLQNNPDVAAIRKAVTNRVLQELKKLGESDTATFAKIWETFGPVIKEGLYEDWERRDALFEVCRFKSTTRDSVTLKDYAAGLKESQTAIYYLTAEDAAKAAASPQLEGYKSRGIEVLLLTDPVDAFWVRTAMGFEGKPFKSVSQGAADLDGIKPADEKKDEPKDTPETATLITAFKQALGARVSDVRASKRLTESACCIVNDGQMDRTLEKLLSRQKDSGVSVSAPVLEINPSHGLIKALGAALKAKGASAVEDAAHLLLDQATMMEGEVVQDPAAFARRLDAIMAKAFG